ncbi:MAG: Rrf2 family transcriptional regulator [Chloroflexi bacterium]|nr:Rrf2 family transcriptional regulator [Chloroflexota bacterium]
MRLSTRGRYGTRALVDIALHYDGTPIPLRDVAARQEISVQYLEQLVSPLVKAGILNSVRGAAGGVRLARPPGEIKLSQVIGILEGSIAPAKCVDDPKACSRSDFCVTRDVWAQMKEAAAKVLESITLQDLVERQKEKGKASTPMYSI